MVPKFRAWDCLRTRMSNVDRIYFDTKGVQLADDFSLYWRKLNDVIFMQSTGVFDKNGVEIFEGDVVQSYGVYNDGESSYIGVVKFVDFCFCIVDKKDTSDPLWNYLGGFPAFEKELTVLGNVYENPDLVEGK